MVCQSTQKAYKGAKKAHLDGETDKGTPLTLIRAQPINKI